MSQLIVIVTSRNVTITEYSVRFSCDYQHMHAGTKLVIMHFGPFCIQREHIHSCTSSPFRLFSRGTRQSRTPKKGGRRKRFLVACYFIRLKGKTHMRKYELTCLFVHVKYFFFVSLNSLTGKRGNHWRFSHSRTLLSVKIEEVRLRFFFFFTTSDYHRPSSNKLHFIKSTGRVI